MEAIIPVGNNLVTAHNGKVLKAGKNSTQNENKSITSFEQDSMTKRLVPEQNLNSFENTKGKGLIYILILILFEWLLFFGNLIKKDFDLRKL